MARGKFIDLTGTTWAQWKVGSRAENSVSGVVRWNCVCSCGKEKIVRGQDLRAGISLSCGCSRSFKLVGKRYGKLTVIEEAGRRGVAYRWLCKCDCGGSTVTQTGNLQSRHTRSCGCLLTEARITHGAAGSKLYKLWEAIKQRCYNKNVKNFNDYGGRGIRMCDDWKASAESFMMWAEPKYKEGLSIDRIDNDGDYSPENCRFSTRSVQSAHQRKQKNNTSGYTGLYRTKYAYGSKIIYKKETVRVGLFPTKEEAVTARNNYIIANNLPHPVQVIS